MANPGWLIPKGIAAFKNLCFVTYSMVQGAQVNVCPDRLNVVGREVNAKSKREGRGGEAVK